MQAQHAPVSRTDEAVFDPVPMPDVRFGMARPEDVGPLTGIEQLRSIPAGLVPAPTMARSMRQWIHAVEEGRVEFRGDPGPEYLNPMGTVHGGWAMTLLDSALGCAIHSVMERGERYASLGTEVKFLRPILPTTGQVRCIGVLVSRGRRTATSEGRIEDQRGRILATGTSTCFITPAGER